MIKKHSTYIFASDLGSDGISKEEEKLCENKYLFMKIHVGLTKDDSLILMKNIDKKDYIEVVEDSGDESDTECDPHLEFIRSYAYDFNDKENMIDMKHEIGFEKHIELLFNAFISDDMNCLNSYNVRIQPSVFHHIEELKTHLKEHDDKIRVFNLHFAFPHSMVNSISERDVF